ncbi:hypothetical protein EDD21DRAFT_14514 [Dissophora ornata]|nr:hypothetical protein EDD21DRAFT_14514 [Dissophora ornata]
MYAHSLILQARSSYFARALNSDWKEANQGIIHKPNITPPVFERILQYIYGGRLMIDDETVMELIKAADELCLEDLLHGCERHALSTIRRGNVLDMVHLASQHNLCQLKTECLEFIANNIDNLKRGKAILTLDADVLKDILSLDQLDLNELEIWKIAVRWAYYQQGLEWDRCPLLEFPKGSGCVIVQTLTDDGAGNQNHDEDDCFDGSDDEFGDAQVPLRGTDVHVGRQHDFDEDGFQPTASVFQQAPTHNVIQLSASVHEDLRKQIAPVLSAIRFMRISSVDFLRLIEGTGLLPVHLCAKVYRYHSVPSMADPYQTSLRRRMAFSTIMSKENKEVVLEWLQASVHGWQSVPSTSNGAWRRRSNAYNNPPYVASSPTGSLLPIAYYSSSDIPSSSTPSISPPVFPPPTMNTPLPSPLLTRGFTVSSPTTNRPTRTGGGDAMSPSEQQPKRHSIQSQQLPQPRLILQYRASRDGFDAANFHAACDQRGPTLTVVRTDTGVIFGGYNSSSWSSHPSGVYSSSRVNFLFALKNREHPSRENVMFNVIGDGNAAAYNKAGFGPTFGIGHDLYLASNCNLSCQSSSTMPSSYNGTGASSVALAGSSNFRVQEYEVFLVQSPSNSSVTATGS